MKTRTLRAGRDLKGLCFCFHSLMEVGEEAEVEERQRSQEQGSPRNRGPGPSPESLSRHSGRWPLILASCHSPWVLDCNRFPHFKMNLER